MVKHLLALSVTSLAFFACEGDYRSPPSAPDQGAVEQGETEPDRMITQEIRQSLMKDENLSLSAKNIIITTRDGIVTIKGKASDEQEKNRIEEHVRSASGGAKSVNNLLILSP